MEVVLDSNVLFRTLISQGGILEVFFHSKLVLLAPEQLLVEFTKNKKMIEKKSLLAKKELDEIASVLLARVSFIRLEKYQRFLPQAKTLLKEHTKDEDFVALALAKGCKIWTYEKLLFSIGLGISTQEISKELNENF